MTHRMKKKPIKEGYKFFALCDAQTGFCYVTFPDGLKDKSGMIWEKVVNLVCFLPECGKRKYIAVMDNYFTQARTIVEVARRGVATVGTTCMSIFKEGELEDSRFNTLYCKDHPGNFRMFCSLDNNIVKLVSNIHSGNVDESVMKARKKPRLNNVNCVTCKTIWKESSVANVKIPQIINNYNYWMLGCDLCDQMIAYYRAKVRCQRTWMPIMFHCLDVLCVNSYVLYQQALLADDRVTNKSRIVDHKTFTKTLIDSLIN